MIPRLLPHETPLLFPHSSPDFIFIPFLPTDLALLFYSFSFISGAGGYYGASVLHVSSLAFVLKAEGMIMTQHWEPKGGIKVFSKIYQNSLCLIMELMRGIVTCSE